MIVPDNNRKIERCFCKPSYYGDNCEYESTQSESVKADGLFMNRDFRLIYQEIFWAGILIILSLSVAVFMSGFYLGRHRSLMAWIYGLGIGRKRGAGAFPATSADDLQPLINTLTAAHNNDDRSHTSRGPSPIPFITTGVDQKHKPIIREKSLLVRKNRLTNSGSAAYNTFQNNNYAYYSHNTSRRGSGDSTLPILKDTSAFCSDVSIAVGSRSAHNSFKLTNDNEISKKKKKIRRSVTVEKI